MGWSLRLEVPDSAYVRLIWLSRSARRGGVIGARLEFTNGLRVDGVRGGFEVFERGHASLAAEDGKDDFSLHREVSR